MNRKQKRDLNKSVKRRGVGFTRQPSSDRVERKTSVDATKKHFSKLMTNLQSVAEKLEENISKTNASLDKEKFDLATDIAEVQKDNND